jgi:hypothetical protein
MDTPNKILSIQMQRCRMNQPTGKGINQPSDRPSKVENTHSDQEKFFRVEMINFSRGGMCFEFGYEVGSGARIRIKRLASPVEQTRHEDDRGCLAEVRWCKPVSGKDAFFYRVGVEYVGPVNPNQCLEWRSGDKICITPPLTLEF